MWEDGRHFVHHAGAMAKPMSGAEATDESGLRERVTERTHLYLAALLRWDGQEGVVRVRNLSPHGAMIEGATLPPAGARVLLMRGSLQASGYAAWTQAGRGGLRMDDLLDVAEWMAPPSNRAQSRVDGLVATLRNGAKPGAPPPMVIKPDGTPPLQLVRRLVAGVADQLSANPVIISGYGRQLQQLELCLQLLSVMEQGADGQARLAGLSAAAGAALDGSPGD